MTEDLITVGEDGIDASWEEPVRVPPPSAAPVLAVEGFEGPLDWLLDLARTERIDLRRISIVALVEAFAASLERALSASARADLARWGEWLVMAAQLALLRSRLLLPPEHAEAKAAHTEAEALRRQLLEADAMRRAALWLGARQQLGRDVFGRGVSLADLASTARVAGIADLFGACLVALRVPEHAESYAPRIPNLWRVQDALARITRLLQEGVEGELGAFLPRVNGQGPEPEHEVRCRAALASTVVAGLELCRRGEIRVTQCAAQGPIRIERLCRSTGAGPSDPTPEARAGHPRSGAG